MMAQRVLDRPATAAAGMAAGTRLNGKLQVLGPLARGSRSMLYSVWHEQDLTKLACKVLLPPWDQDSRAIERLVREGEILASLAHPNIVRVFEINYSATPTYLLLELLDGPDLGRLLAQRGQLSVPAAAAVGAEIGGALAHLHRQGMLHLDIKPRNIVMHQGSARLVDLGIAGAPGKRLGAGPGSGTPGYMAPEQQGGGTRLTEAADIFALGCVLFEALTGARAVPTLQRVAGGAAAAPVQRFPLAWRQADLLHERRPRTPRAMQEIVVACLEPLPEDRPESMAEVVTALLPYARPRRRETATGAVETSTMRRSA